MPTTFANTINGNEILAKRSQCDYAGNDLQTTYATKTEVTTGLAGKQDTISDLDTIRSGAQAGATAVQPGDLATVATTGAYSDLSGTPTIPTATSDLTNDSGFITLSDVPAQVNADWNSSSGASEILNKPTIPSGTQLVPSATSADEDKVLTVDSQGVPGWASAQAPISAGDGIDITNNVVSADVAAPLAINTDDEIWLKTGRGLDTQAGLQSDELEVRLSGTGGLMYDSNDDDGLAIQLAQYSGLEVQMNNGVQEGLNVLVDGTTIDKNASGELTVIGGGGGGTQADWTEDDPADPSYIENKPTPKTLTGGTNIVITEDSSTITISATCQNAQADWTESDPTQPAYIQHKPTIPSGNQLVPAATSQDEGKCLVVDSNGDPEWGTGGKTYTGTDGVVVDNVNDTVGLEAPVDIVAGPGIVIDNPDGNTLRVSVAQAQFTELYYNATNTNDTAGKVYQLSEPITNFAYAKITVDNMEFANNPLVYEIDVQHNTTTCNWISPLRNGNLDNTINLPVCRLKINSDGNLVLDGRSLTYNTYPSPQNTNGASRGFRVVRVVGIFRISGGN